MHPEDVCDSSNPYYHCEFLIKHWSISTAAIINQMFLASFQTSVTVVWSIIVSILLWKFNVSFWCEQMKAKKLKLEISLS